MPERGRSPKPGAGLFPATRPSAIFSIKSADDGIRARSRDLIAAAYWRPIYKYLRLKWNRSAEEAEDLTQAFFSKAFESDLFAAYDPTRARFRTFVRLCVDRFVMKADEADRALKRGGGAVVHGTVELGEAERKLADTSADVEAAFDREWARSVIAMSVDTLANELEARGKGKYFAVFERYELQAETAKTSYADVASSLGISVTDVTNYLFVARRELRRIVLSALRDLTANEDEFREEAKALLGIDV